MKKILYTILGLALFTSCNKKEVLEEVNWGEREAPQFEVSTVKDTYKVGEKVTFTIDGDAGMLDFWSGEVGNDYDYREGRFLPAPDKIEVQLRIRHQYQTRTGGTFSVLVSSDFDGDRESFDDVDAIEWTDITDRLGPLNEGAQADTYTVDVTEFREEGKPMYFALKYIFDPTKGSTGSWPQLSTIYVRAVAGEEAALLSGSLSSDFPKYAAVSVNKNPIRSLNRYYEPVEYPTSNILVIQPNAAATVNGIPYYTNTYTEEYFVSVPYHVGAQELGPDKPLTLTNHSRPLLGTFSYTYNQPGVYKVKFIGTDPSLKENNQTIKELEITITE